jgi:5'-methylthioadenosine phosphorylase
MVVANLLANAQMAKRLIAEAVERVPAERGCSCGTALATAIITSPDSIPADIKRELAPLIGKYVK